MASLRKAEIRRMGEKGQNFVVKQVITNPSPDPHH